MEKVKNFLVSDGFTAALILMASVIVFTGQEVLGTMLFVLIIGISLALTNDFMPALQAIMITACFAIRCKHSFNDFIKLWWLAPPIVILVAFYFFYYKHGFSKGSCFKGIAAVSVAVTIGGLGIITAKEYFSPTSLFYIFMLGFGMLIIHMYMNSELKIRDNYSFSQRFSKIMVSVIIMLCICLFEEYFSRRAELAGFIDILPFQWRNNAASLLMIAMPFPFYLSAKKFPFFFVGLLSYAAILLTGSRGGMIFGLIEAGVCCVVMFIIDKRHRPAIAAIVTACIFVALLLSRTIFDILSYTIARLLSPDENSIRLGLLERGIEDFKANPLFGRGIGYMGNRDIHQSAEFTLCWYHCSPVQVIGSFGLTGVAAYGYLLYLRIKTLIKNVSFFNIMIFISYIGIEMMSFVNPGVFAPFPYLFLVTIEFIIMENCNNDSDKKELAQILSGGKR